MISQYDVCGMDQTNGVLLLCLTCRLLQVATAFLVYCTSTLLPQRFTSSIDTYLAKAIGSRTHTVLLNPIIKRVIVPYSSRSIVVCTVQYGVLVVFLILSWNEQFWRIHVLLSTFIGRHGMPLSATGNAGAVILGSSMKITHHFCFL